MQSNPAISLIVEQTRLTSLNIKAVNLHLAFHEHHPEDAKLLQDIIEHHEGTLKFLDFILCQITARPGLLVPSGLTKPDSTDANRRGNAQTIAS